MPTADRMLREVRRFVAAAHSTVDSDRALVERFARSRDEDAFAELVRRHGPMVLGVCRRVLRHAADADDAFQAIFLILVRRAGQLRDPDRLGAWLFGVAWRVANKLRASRRCGFSLPEDLPAREPPVDWPVELDAAIARLPEKYRTPIVLCHLQGLSTAEAAHRLGCPAATLTTRLFRARNTLRRRLTALRLAVPVALAADSVLHVPSALAAATHEMATGRSISPAAANLADGVLRSLLMSKIRWAATAAAVCLTSVGILGFRAGGQEPGTVQAPPTAAAVAPPPVASEGEQPATVKSANFRVTGPSARIARLIADAAERARKDAAMTWLGKELPVRTEACRIKVKISPSGSGGATSFDFSSPAISADMQVEGTLDRVLSDVIPHEVTHVVLAEHFRKQLPRWVDEGIAVLSEDEAERHRYARLCAEALNAGRGIQLKTLLAYREFPRDVMVFYSESYYLTKFLADRKDNATLLNFVRSGMTGDWETAAKEFYGVGLDELEKEMLDKLRTERIKSSGAGLVPAPVLVMATADSNGTVTLLQPGYTHKSVTTYVRREADDGNGKKRTYFEPVTEYLGQGTAMSESTFPRGTIRAMTTAGKPVSEAAMIEALKGRKVAVAFLGSQGDLDPAYADILKPDTLVLVVPSVPAQQPPPVAPPTSR